MIYIAGLLVSIIANAENRVAVIDTGINVNEKNAPYLCKTGHKDFTGMGLYDDLGHGTQVVNYIIDNAKTKNFCVVMLKFYDPNLSVQRVVANTVAAYLEARRQRIKLVNYSANGTSKSPEEEKFIQDNQDMTFVVAAGNDGVNLDESPRYPASYGLNNIIPVGALNKDGERQSISNYGSLVLDWEEASATSYATAIRTGKIVNKRFAR
jgi:hypothetical protein